MKQSGMLKRRNSEIDFYANMYMTIIQQFMIDTLQITLHQTEGWGHDRLRRISDNWEKTRKEYYPAIDPKHPECDVAQEHMDRIFAQICEGHAPVIPSHDRYPNLKKVRY